MGGELAGWASPPAHRTAAAPAEAIAWEPARTPRLQYRPHTLTSQDGSIPPTLTSPPRPARNATWLSPETCVLDVGENGAGWSRLVVRNGAPTGVRISMAHSEMVMGAGGVGGDIFNQFPCSNPPHVCVNQTDHYTTAGQSTVEVYEPRFTWHGFRYVRLTGCTSVILPGTDQEVTESPFVEHDTAAPPWACEVSAIRVGTNFDSNAVASPTADDNNDGNAEDGRAPALHLSFPKAPLLEAIATAIQRTLLSNQLGYQTSCPTREKVAWTGDSLATAPSLLLAGGTTAVLPYVKNYMRSLRDNQILSYMPWNVGAPNGSIDDTVPHIQFQSAPLTDPGHNSTCYPSHNGSWPGDNGGWSPVYPLTMLLLYDTDGDASSVARNYPPLRAFMTTTIAMCGKIPSPPAAHGQPGSKCGFYGDWSSPLTRFSSAAFTGQVISSAYLILQLDAMARLAQVAGETGDAADYAAKAAAGRAAYEAAYWNETIGTYGNDSRFVQTYSVVALRVLFWPDTLSPSFGAGGYAPNATRKHLASATLLDDLRQRGYKHTVGLIGWRHLFDVLSKVMAADGGHAAALRLALSTEFPSVGFMLESLGYGSTLWERWDAPVPTSDPDSLYNNTSLNHPMFGSMLEWIVQQAAGLDASKVGSERRVRLRASSAAVLDRAAVAHDTVLGRVAWAWETTTLAPAVGTAPAAREVHMNATLPVGGIHLDLVLPVALAAANSTDAGGQLVRFAGIVADDVGVAGGEEAADETGIISARVEAGQVVAAVLVPRAGTYRWKATFSTADLTADAEII